ncbi:MAG: siderophore-interacting protein, partial [Cellulosilyticaceae bacterium]
MKDSHYSKVEGILYNFPKLKVEIDNLRLDLEDVNEVVGIRGASGNEKAGSSTHAFSSAVEDEVIARD